MRAYMISNHPSPPQEAEQIRGQTLTPQSPKPVHIPSPSNIPILEDPMFHESAPTNGTSAHIPPYPQTQTPSAQSATSLYADPQTATGLAQNAAAPGAVGAASAGYAQATAYNSGFGAQAQDTTSIQNYLQKQGPASSHSEPNAAPYQNSQPAYPAPYDPNAYQAHQTQAQPPTGTQYPAQASNGNGVSYQALLDSLAANGANTAPDRYQAQPAQSQIQSETSPLPAAPNLPPRPPPQDKSVTSPHYNPNEDIRSYHPHSQKPASNQFRGQGQLQPLNVRGGGNTSSDVQSARSNQSPITPGYGSRQSVDLQSETADDEDSRWPPEINRLYEDFLEEERKYVTDGQWDQFPYGSRLFIGNLPTEKVTKRDIFHRFYRHGKLAQISIKQAYGFVQFLDVASASKALQTEQGQTVRGRKMHLEVSKIQRNTRKADSDRNSGGRRRSRSPDYNRGGTGPQSRNVDRYTGGNAMSPRDRESRRYRDDYRRSPSPQRGGRRGRDRSRERYDGRRRSWSRSPRRYRSPSPRRSFDDDCPLPFREPHQIPDIQVLVVSEGLPNDYIRWVEDTFKKHGLRADVLILSARLSEVAVVRRQIVEGVLAVVKLNSATLAKSKVNLQVFDRRAGSGNVTFNEYADLEPETAAALVMHVKNSQSQPQAQAPQPPAAPTYGYNYGMPPAAPAYPNAPPPAAQYANPAASNPTNPFNLLSSLDPNSISQILGAMQQKPAQQQAPAAEANPDIARLLASISAPQQQQQQPAYAAQPAAQNYANPYQNPSFASLLGGQAPQQQMAAPQTQAPAAAGQPDMNQIMAQLAKYRPSSS